MSEKESILKQVLDKQLKQTNDYSILTSDGYIQHIKKTVITIHSSSKAVFTWYDTADGVLASCTEQDYQHSALPRIGKVEIKNRKTDYMRGYNKTTRQFHLRLTHKDADVTSILENCNVQGYIKELIREDAKKGADARLHKWEKKSK